ncbi:hypothetical protein FisN_2Lu092 [Fistulifera solaris]|uniref:Uncharacterized protein n=1 Tax=Fistulifera solaris TaxID=1519565 RepID=A0A1Z5JX07_FISSO|nr:hypothetical protein FisN_2Lu092 [Fistulifera solaris]|eukprot:GAX18429.1 hypothetical protein FisN_2Lu092 [Fistulifera solaris]
MSSGYLFTAVYFLLLVFSAIKRAVVSAQSSCSAAQSIQVQISITPGSIEMSEGFEDIYFLCERPLSSTDLPPGLWFTYLPSETTVARISTDTVTNEEFSYASAMAIFADSCDSLTCIEEISGDGEVLFQAEAGIKYFILVYREWGTTEDPLTLSLDEIVAPSNDNWENAIPLTHQDLPYKGDFTTFGALSDFNQDACGLEASYGVWFTYTTTLPEETVLLKTTSSTLADVIGIQARSGEGVACVAMGNPQSTEWTAVADTQYYILITDHDPAYGAAFELSLQSRTFLGPPTSPAIPDSPNPASAAGDQTSVPVMPPSLPIGAPMPSMVVHPAATSPVTSPETLPSASEAYPSEDLFKACLYLVVLFLFVV